MCYQRRNAFSELFYTGQDINVTKHVCKKSKNIVIGEFRVKASIGRFYRY